MTRIARSFLTLAFCAVLAGAASAASLKIITKCPPDAVLVGQTCVDKYETSVWQIPPSDTALVKKVQQGKATLDDLIIGGATQLGCPFPPFNQTAYPANFPRDGNWIPVLGSDPPSAGVYAASVAGVVPSACITWFQANQACALSGKRLVRNDEWQRAAAGTPDPGTDNETTDCAVLSPDPVNAGSRSSCKSSWGVFDMVGNLNEWVADWADHGFNCADWTSTLGIAGDDQSCFGGDGGGTYDALPAALIRGGAWNNNVGAGVFTVHSSFYPSDSDNGVGPIPFGSRCAR